MTSAIRNTLTALDCADHIPTSGVKLVTTTRLRLRTVPRRDRIAAAVRRGVTTTRSPRWASAFWAIDSGTDVGVSDVYKRMTGQSLANLVFK